MAKLKIQNTGEEVLAGDVSRNGNGHTSLEPAWQDSIPTQFNKFLDIPGIKDFAGILAMSNITDKEDIIAYLRIIRRLEKGLSMAKTEEEKEMMTSRLEFVRQCLASTLGYKGLGITLKLQREVQLVMPAVVREQIGIKHAKRGEDSVRGSDFRQQSQQSAEPKGDTHQWQD